jgi:SSS family solute:Na+ symporter
MMLLAWGLGLYLPWKLYGGVQPMFERIAVERPELLLAPGLDASGQPWNWGEYSTAVLVSIIGFAVWPHLFMKAFTARDDRTIKRTVVLYPTFQIFLVPLFLIGFSGVFFHSAPPSADQILPHMLMNMEIPALLVGLFCAGALAASMSSGDAMVHAAASIAVRDGLVEAGGLKLDPHAERKWIRGLVVAIMIASYVVATLYRGSLVNLLLSAYGAVVQFAPVVWATLYSRRATGPGIVAGLVVGALTTMLCVLWPDLRPFPLHAGIYGVVLNLIVLVAVSALTSPRAPERESEFLAVASRRDDRATEAA